MSAPVVPATVDAAVVPVAPAVPAVAPAVEDKGFPEATPLAEMTDKQQAAYWKHYARQHEGRVQQMSDYDSLKDKAAQYDALSEASRTDQERAIQAARDEAKAAALQEAAPRLVRAEFRAAAKGVLTDAARDAILEDLDFSKYLTDKGEVDEAKVAAKVAALAPTEPQRPPVQLGQGRTGTDAKPSVETGRALYEQHRGARKSA